ncbi:hypothetical protein Plec18167_000324 [Paecilomyces lecythidis]|uniref:Trafficking protein particle complex subunit 11 n=1 Tax=Paecilomyces lecythidis TaxID=3004212 RepID=A0ABR3YE37_9EURO
MDAYPEDYIAHNLPYVLLCGLEADTEDPAESSNVQYPFLFTKGTEVSSHLPAVSGPVAEELRKALLEEDASEAPWNSLNEIRRTGGIGLKVKSIGRSYRLPPRKADPPSSSPPTSPPGARSDSASSLVLHSPISPLTPSSPVFPDGLLTPLWVTKHQNLIPAVTINFFSFASDPNLSTLRDNQLKTEINTLKKDWVTSGCKTRFVVVLLSEEGESSYVVDTEERVASIRKATNLDPRSIHVLPSDLTPLETREFARSLLSSLQPTIGEYYRDLSKHARRKRNRGSIPPPTAPPTTGTSQTLSFQGWNVRYEFKLGIFAEFRQEMDAACRNYESAYETLFGQEVFETIAGWNPRFNEARLLGDVLALRILRCLLWNGQYSVAVRSWVAHKHRTRDIVNRRGKGTKNYGWQAWEARWAMVMAQLIQGAEIPELACPPPVEDLSSFTGGIFISAEKIAPEGERVMPWQLLHHEGYWIHQSARHSIRRRILAEQIPPEDRMSPGQSPASQIANKSHLYDTYLVPEPHIEAGQPGKPGFDHCSLIVATLKLAMEEFSKREQLRKVEHISLEMAKEYMKAGSWSEAMEILRPLWPQLSWRSAGWWQLMQEVGWALRRCALQLKDSETLLRVHWELLNNVFSRRSDWDYDLHKSLDDFPQERPKPAVALRSEDVVSCLTASLVFERPHGNVGEPLRLQLAITSRAQPESPPIRLSEVKVVFEGGLRPIKLLADESAPGSSPGRALILPVTLRDSVTSTDSSMLQSPTHSLASMTGTTDLSIQPSQTKAFDLTSIPREAGEARIASITLMIEEEKFDLAYSITDLSQSESFWWQDTGKGPIRKRIGKDRDTHACKILPKPPKIRLAIPNLREAYYTNEHVSLDISIHNEEDEMADLSMDVRLFGHPESVAKLAWADEEIPSEVPDEDAADSSPMRRARHSLRRSIGTMESVSKQNLSLVLSDTTDAFDYELELSVLYHLVSDPETPISKTLTVELSFVRPFEANYEFLPRLHPQPWPNFFRVDEELGEESASSPPNGLQQRWCLNSKLVSFAPEPLVVERVALVLLGINGGANCEISSETLLSPETPVMALEELRESEFVLNIQKLSLEDRRSVSLNLALEIQWRRADSEENSESTTTLSATTPLAIPRFVVPIGEPRILASAISSETIPGFIHLDYTLENPSLHFLTFSLTMEVSDQFAFSGPKSTTVQLVPLSRHTIRYNLLASKRGLWIQPQLVVVDTYFNKTLRILPTEGMRSDKRGILIWVDADE